MGQLAANDHPSLAEVTCRAGIIELLRQMQAYPHFENVDLVAFASRRTALGAYVLAIGWAHALPVVDQGSFLKGLSDISKGLL
jgi:hypothetical protein